jgi:hypothetical protein
MKYKTYLIDIVDVDGARDDGRSKEETEKCKGDCGASSTTTTTTTATFVFGFILTTATSTTTTTPTHLDKRIWFRNLKSGRS